MEEKVIKNVEDVKDLIRGLTLLGTGGGGRADLGMDYLLPHVEGGKMISLLSPETIPDDAWTCSVFGMGSIAPQKTLSPEERKALGYGEWRVAKPFVEAVRELTAYTGHRIDAIVPFELGAGNTPAPMDTALRLGMKVIDGDYAGRAIPELAQTTPALEGRTFEPGTICDPWGNVLIMKKSASLKVAERIGKMISIATKLPDIKAPCAHAGFLLKGKEMKRLIIAGGISLSLEIGRRIRRAMAEREDPALAAAEAMKGWVLFRGRVRRKEWESREGYMFGTTTIEGGGPDSGHTLKVWFKNENHVTYLDEKPFVTSPDLIAIINTRDGEPYTNTFLEEGMEVAVLGARADEKYRSREGLALLSPQYFGLDIDYVPVENYCPRR
jgi:uncharacterized protein